LPLVLALTGAEITGELGECFARGSNEVIYVMPDQLPFTPPVKPNVCKAVSDALEKLKVRIIPNARVTAVIKSVGGQTTLELMSSDSKTQTTVTDKCFPVTSGPPLHTS